MGDGVLGVVVLGKGPPLGGRALGKTVRQSRDCRTDGPVENVRAPG